MRLLGKMLLGTVLHTAFEDGSEDGALQAETFLFVQVGMPGIPGEASHGASHWV